MLIDYSVSKTFAQTLDVVDPGNCVVKCGTDDGITFLIKLKSVMGRVYLLSYGPVSPDSDGLLADFKVSYKSFKFNPKTIFKELSSFVNDPYKQIVEAEESTDEVFNNLFPDIIAGFDKC